MVVGILVALLVMAMVIYLYYLFWVLKEIEKYLTKKDVVMEAFILELVITTTGYYPLLKAIKKT